MMQDREATALERHGVNLEEIQESYDIVVLPENAEGSDRSDELFDASDSAALVKRLRAEGARAGNSLNVGIDCGTLERRSDDLWLGLVWIISNVAWPFLVAVMANMFTDRVRGAKPGEVHVKLRWRKGGKVKCLDWKGDGATLANVLKVLHESESDQEE